MIGLRVVTVWLFVTWAVSIVLAAPPTWTSSPVSGPVKGTPVWNYGVVDQDLLSRSALPKEQGYTWLRRQGVISVVNLMMKDVGEVYLRGLGFQNYLWLPLHGPPTDDAQAERFLQFVGDSRNWPVHVHCAEGKDRTGGLVALVRYAIDGWPIEKALEEARLYRKGEDLTPKFLEWLERWGQRHPPGSHRPVGHGNGKSDSAR